MNLLTAGRRRHRGRDVLLAASRIDTADEELRALVSGVDASELLDLAEYHRLTALLYHRLSLAGAVPGELSDRLEALSHAAQVQRLRAQRTIRTLGAIIEVPFLVVKGTVLATQWYDDPAQREFNDVDVLVPPRDFAHTFDRLTSAGFDSLTRNWHGFLEHGVAEVPLRGDSSIVDLHWDLVAVGHHRSRLSLPTAELFDRAESIVIDSTDVFTLDPTDTLVHLCVNTGLDGARRLRGLVDIDTVMRSSAVDLGEFARRANNAGAAPLAAALLQRSRTLLGTPIPDELLETLVTSRTWLAVNSMVDRMRTRRRSSDGIASGLLLSSGRPSRTATAQAFTRSARDAMVTRAGRPGLSGPGGELDWQRVPDDGNEPLHRARYFEFVALQTRPVRLVRCRDADELHRRLGSLQPRTTPMLGAAFQHGLRGRRARADILEFDDGETAGALLRYRWTIGRCTGYPIIVDGAAAAPLGALIDRSGATDLSGMDSDTAPLMQNLTRWRDVTLATPATLPPGFVWAEQSTNVRRADRSDLDHLVEVFWRYSPHAFPNRWLLRSRLARSVDDLVLVLEADEPSRPVGYAIRDSSTPEYDYWAHGVIEPEHRGEGLSWQLVAAAAAETSSRGLGGLVCVVDSNPMPIPEDAVVPEAWTYVRLTRPRRVRGEGRARAWLDRFLQLPNRFDRSPIETHGTYRSPGADDQRITHRRTQAWWTDSRVEPQVADEA